MHEAQSDMGIDQFALHSQVADILGIKTKDIAGWYINRIRPDGLIDAEVPLGSIDASGVPTDPQNIDRLEILFDEFEDEVGGTGQRDAVVVCHVPGEAFYLADGFHRHEVQTRRGKDTLNAIIEPNQTYEQVVKRRLEYAHTHPEIEFARQVEWMQSIWERTPWVDQLPNVLTAFRAIKPDYADDRTDDVALIDDLSDTDFEDICQWVKTKSTEWGYTPKEIRENLARAESFDPELMRLVYQKKGTPPEGRIGIGHVEVITGVYGGEFDLQEEVVKLVVKNRLTVPQTQTMLDMIEEHSPPSLAALKRVVKKIDMAEVLAASRSKTSSSKRTSSNGNRPSGPGINETNTFDLLRTVHDRLEGESDEWTDDEAEAAVDVVIALSGAVIRLAENRETTPANLLNLQANLGVLAVAFSELSEEIENLPDNDMEPIEDDEPTPTPAGKVNNGSNGSKERSNGSSAADAAANGKLGDSITEFLRGKNKQLPRLMTMADVQRANEILAEADGRWSRKLKEQLEDAVDEAEIRIEARSKRMRNRALR